MMEIPMIDSYLETLAGYICDEDKLVTYKWLSKELEVHVNIAKIILWRYWQKHKDDKLVATFMLIGNLKEGGMRVEVVKDCDLEKAKEKFEKIISEHIYSLQKTLLDIELLAGAGKGDSKYSAITCSKSVVLSEDELLKMRWGKAQPPKGATTEKKAPPEVQNKKEAPAVKEAPKKEEIKETEAKSEEKPKKVSPPKPKSNEKKGASKKPIQSTKAGFGHLFANAGNQKKPQTSSSSSDNATNDKAKKDSAHSPDKKDSKSAAETLFGKAKAKENEDSTNVPMEVEVSSPEEKEEKKSSSSSKKSEKSEKTQKIEKPEKNEKTSSSKKTKASKNKKSNRGTKRGRSQDSEEETKKRKRIIMPSDSSEESANESANEDMFESPPAPSPKKEKSPSPSPVKQEGNKRKVRKLVDKTFMDEDGFLITKKEHVWESCSEEEEPEVVEKKKKVEAEKPKETKESKMPVKKKQTSLMSFFKKA